MLNALLLLLGCHEDEPPVLPETDAEPCPEVAGTGCDPGADGELFDGCVRSDDQRGRFCDVNESLADLCFREFGGPCPTLREFVSGVAATRTEGGYATACTTDSGEQIHQYQADESLGEITDRWHSGTIVTQTWADWRRWTFDACGRVMGLRRYQNGYPAPVYPGDPPPTWCCGGVDVVHLEWGAREPDRASCEDLDPEDFASDPTLGTCDR